jgi:hypothetical protein
MFFIKEIKENDVYIFVLCQARKFAKPKILYKNKLLINVFNFAFNKYGFKQNDFYEQT